MKITESRCNGCAECVHCGRSEQESVYYECDKCGEEADFRYGGKDYCCECLTVQLEKDGVIEEILE